MVTCTMDIYVFPLLASCTNVSITYDLWMSQCGFHTFHLVANLVDDGWIPRHVTVGIFKVADTSRVALAKVVKRFVEEFGLIEQAMGHVKNEGTNMNMLATTLKYVVKCKLPKIEEPFHGTCFGHVD